MFACVCVCVERARPLYVWVGRAQDATCAITICTPCDKCRDIMSKAVASRARILFVGPYNLEPRRNIKAIAQ